MNNRFVLYAATRAYVISALALLSAVPHARAAEYPLVGREQLSAILWMQSSPEYRASALQTYQAATQALTAIETRQGTASVEQGDRAAADLAALPTAVVLDLDETVLDNSVYQAQLLREGREYAAETWGPWIALARADAIPGALKFVRAAVAAGHKVIYVTNRDCKFLPATATDPCPAQTATMRNLELLGFPGASDPEALMMRNESPQWAASSKSARRAAIAQRYRIVMLVGDDLGDFVDQAVYAARAAELAQRFGKQWFVLPNAMYGSWAGRFATVEAKYAGLRATPSELELTGLGAWDTRSKRLRLATWNVEYLLEPATHLALRDDCAEEGSSISGDERRLPCSIARRGPRTADDYAALRKYAAAIRGDVVALEEVDGPAAAALVFPGYEFCFSSRAHVQKNGFAIRRGLPFRCEPEYLPLSLEDEVRRGVVVTLFPATVNEMTLMVVHLKSGCPAGPLTADNQACAVLARQVAPLEQWIDAQAAAGKRFAVLGDFNRRFSLEKPPARARDGRQLTIFPEIDDQDPPAADLTDVAAGRRFVACDLTSPFREYIDVVLLGSELAKRRVRNGFIRVAYSEQDSQQRWLSDHCPVGTELRLQ
jgi:5'-nucleotidase (lipoprotein e(P4) family)